MAYTKIGDKQIYYEVHGEGLPLVILNGIMMSTVSWKMFLPALKDFKVILIDFLDQGKSTSMNIVYDHELQVDCVYQVLEDLKLNKVFMTGISYGGQVALTFAAKYSHRLIKLAVFNGASYTTPWLKDIGLAWQLAARTGDPELFYHVTIPYIYSPNFYTTNYTWMMNRKNILLNVFTNDFLDRIDRLITSSEEYDIRNELADIHTPILVVGTCDDYITPIGEARAMCKEIPNSTFLTIEGCGHASMYEAPEAFVSLIRGFLTDDKSVKVL